MFAVAVLAGVGFTVSLLIGDLAFAADPGRQSSTKIGILLASAISAVLATFALLRRGRAYTALAEVEEADSDGDGVPDVYQR